MTRNSLLSPSLIFNLIAYTSSDPFFPIIIGMLGKDGLRFKSSCIRIEKIMRLLSQVYF